MALDTQIVNFNPNFLALGVAVALPVEDVLGKFESAYGEMLSAAVRRVDFDDEDDDGYVDDDDEYGHEDEEHDDEDEEDEDEDGYEDDEYDDEDDEDEEDEDEDEDDEDEDEDEDDAINLI